MSRQLTNAPDQMKRIGTSCRWSLVLLFVSLTSLASQAQLSIPLTIQEALYSGAPTNGINRSQDPVTVGIPLPDSARITSTSQLGLAGAQVGQFRILGRWPSGNIKWVLVDTQADVTAGAQNTSISLTNGSGNFGGPDLASDNGSTVAVNTGPAQFTIRKANFNLFDQVVVNGKVLVASGTSPGLVVMGPAPGNTSCGSCTQPYASSNDPSSTAVIEENGPARAVIKVDGSHMDTGGHAYMHFTVRMYFYRGKTSAKVEVILRNADETNSTAGDFNSAFKGFTSYEARVRPALSSARSFSFATPDATAAGNFTGAESAYLYQAYSNDMESADWNATNCTAAGSSRCVASYISRTPNSGGGYTYSQDGYEIVHGASLLARGDHTQYPQGWADLSDSSGAGIEIGVYQMSAYWPKSLQFVNGGTEARVGIWPDQGLFTGGGGQPYYQAWPAYSIHDLYFNFHNTALASPANDFLAFQHYLVARAPRAQYNTAGVFFYPLIDPGAEDNYYRSLSVGCCMTDKAPRIFRFYDWPGGGAGNQHDLRWAYLLNFLQRGQTGRYLFAAQFYRMVAEKSLPRSDGFDWRNHPVSQLNYIGLPTEIASANGALATRNWADSEHAHWYGMTDYYFMTGDETIKDQLMDGVADDFLNPNTTANSGHLPDTRDIGVRLTGMARFYQFLQATADPNLSALGSIADSIITTQVVPELNVSGFGTGDPVPGGSQGVSRTRGLHYGCCNRDNVGSLSGREVAPFREALLVQGLWEMGQARGAAWPNYRVSQDLAYGISQWATNEAYGAPPGQIPTAMNSGFIYEIFLDQANGSSPYYMAPGDGQTNWIHFYYPGFYSGDMSWRQKFEWLLQRVNANFSLSIWAEYGSHMIQQVVAQVLNPPSLHLVNVPLRVTSNGAGSYALSWTVPQGAISYRIKDYPGKSIVDWIGFNAGSNTFTGDPNRNWPWFAATEVNEVPLPAAGGSTQTFTVSGLDPTQNFNFALKAYVPSGASSGDTTPPSVSIISPGSGATLSGTATLSASASDAGGVAGVLFEVDGQTIGTPVATAPYSISLNTAQFTNGSHTLTAVATDLAGNSAQASVVVTINNSGSGDTVPPTVSIIAPTAGATVSGTITITANAGDNVAVSSVAFKVDGTAINQPITASPYSVSLNTTQLSNGPHTLTAIASDLAGNTAQASVQVTVANSGTSGGGGGGNGVLSFTSPAPDSTISGTVTISVTASQSFPSVQFQIDGANFGVALLSAPYAVAWDTTHVSNGPHTISAIAGASVASITVQVVNGSSPVGAVATAGVDANTQFVVDLQDIWSLQACSGCAFQSANDLIAGQTTQVVLRPGAGSPMADQVVLRQGVLNGTVNSVQGSQFTLQLAPGSLGPATVLVVSGAKAQLLNLAAGVQVGQNLAVRGLLFKSGPQAMPTLLANEIAQGSTLPGTSSDTTPPTVSLTYPAGGAIVSGTITLTSTASDNVGVASVLFQVDGQQVGSTLTSEPYAVSLNTGQLSNGFHTLTAVATDAAGNSAQASVTVTVSNTGGGDTIPPLVAITAPATGATVSGTVTFSANASDNVQVASVVFQADGHQIGAAVTGLPYAVQLDTTRLSNGVHTLTVVATDLAGNSAQASRQVTVSNAAANAATLAPTRLSFGTQTVGATGSPQNITLRNGTSSTLSITSISASGDFAQTNNCGTSLPAGASCNISVTFRPSAVGTRNGTLTVVDNNSSSPQTAQLTGTGASGTGSNCAPGQWCQVLPNGSVSRPADEGWNALFFSHDTGKFYLFANSGQDPTDNPWENAFLSYTVQGQPANSNPWAVLSDCGDTALTIARQVRLSLASGIGPGDSQLTLNIGGGALDNPNFPQSGTIWLDDEAISFNGCTSQGGNGACQTGASNLTLLNLQRGVRRAAGYLAAGAHAAGAYGNLACPNPTLNGAPTTDHPPARHPVAATTYDSRRGRIWEAWGYQELWQLRDTWYLCVFQTASCSAAQISAGWQRLPLFTTGGANPPQYMENAMVYDPDHDVIFEFGGTKMGATSDSYLFCLSAGPGAAYGCTDPASLNKWVRLTPHDGTPLADDGMRMSWDPVHHVVLTYGGTLPDGTALHIVQQYHPATGDWCLSDTSQGGTNAASCSLPAVSGPTPPGVKFPEWTFDNLRGKGVFYAGVGAIYTYDPAQNQWTLIGVPGGPGPSSYSAGASWAYDDISDTFVYVTNSGPSGFETWELPGSALGH